VHRDYLAAEALAKLELRVAAAEAVANGVEAATVDQPNTIQQLARVAKMLQECVLPAVIFFVLCTEGSRFPEPPAPQLWCLIGVFVPVVFVRMVCACGMCRHNEGARVALEAQLVRYGYDDASTPAANTLSDLLQRRQADSRLPAAATAASSRPAVGRCARARLAKHFIVEHNPCRRLVRCAQRELLFKLPSFPSVSATRLHSPAVAGGGKETEDKPAEGDENYGGLGNGAVLDANT
jgi:hypothetical protein